MMPVRIKNKKWHLGKGESQWSLILLQVCILDSDVQEEAIKFALVLPDTFASTNSCMIFFLFFIFYGFSSGKRMLKRAEPIKTQHSRVALSLCLQYTCKFLHVFSLWKPLHQPHRGTLQHKYYIGSHSSHVTVHVWKVCQAISLL